MRISLPSWAKSSLNYKFLLMALLASERNRNTAKTEDRIRRSSTTNDGKSWKEHSPKKSSCTAIGLSDSCGLDRIQIFCCRPADLIFEQLFNWMSVCLLMTR